MNLSKSSDKEKLEVCRKYFLGGLAFLPVLWLVNLVWFFKYAFLQSPFPEQAKMRRYLIQSAVGCALWLVAIVIWNFVFQFKRVDWGLAGDQLTFIIPRGRA